MTGDKPSFTRAKGRTGTLLSMFLVTCLSPVDAFAGRGNGKQAAPSLVPSLESIVGDSYDMPPELSDRAWPGTVLQVNDDGYTTVRTQCVDAEPIENPLTNIQMQDSLAGGVSVSLAAGRLGANATYSLNVNFISPFVAGYELVSFIPSDACRKDLQSLFERTGSLDQMFLVQESMFALVSGCSERSATAKLGLRAVSVEGEATKGCQMFSDAPVAVGVRLVPLSSIRELAQLTMRRHSVDHGQTKPENPGGTQTPAPQPVAEPDAGAAGYAMRRVPAGTFPVGCTMGQSACKPHERPGHVSTVTRDYWIGVTEVSQELWQKVTKQNPAKHVACGPSCPVEMVSWLDAAKFANAMSRYEGLEECYSVVGEQVRWTRGPACLGYRLPTEAEWEIAARSGEDLDYSGSSLANTVAWWRGSLVDFEEFSPQPVAQKQPNGFGLYDMSGNVAEWTWNWMGSYRKAQSLDPMGPQYGEERVLRGGGFNSLESALRVSSRDSDDPLLRHDSAGVRLVRTAGP